MSRLIDNGPARRPTAAELVELMSSLAPVSQQSSQVGRSPSEVEHQGRCTACGHQNPTAYQFCSNCGHRLA